MFRVPIDSRNPSFDRALKVGFWRWLTSSKAQRAEWQRRRNAAAEAARQGQNARAQEWADRHRHEQ
jgi:hypothetical protein